MNKGTHLLRHAAFREALEIFARLGHRRGVARVLEGYACLALAEEQAERALTLAAAAAELRKLISAPLSQAEQSQLDKTLQRAWEALSESEARAPGRGSAMSLEEAMHYSLRTRKLLQICRVNEASHRRDTIGWNTCAARVLPNAFLIRRKVNTVDLVFSDVTVKPLNLRSHRVQSIQRAQRNLPDLHI